MTRKKWEFINKKQKTAEELQSELKDSGVLPTRRNEDYIYEEETTEVKKDEED